MVNSEQNFFGIGIGLRRENSEALVQSLPREIECLEIAPENYFQTGGKLYRELKYLSERYPIVFHGLSLSVGSLQALDREYLRECKSFLKEFNASWMSDHLCYASVMGARFHDLLPLPFTREAIQHVVPRIRQVQDSLEMPLSVENISYYAHPGDPEMTEWEFVTEVVERADCRLLLDVNNVYVNSVNHGFDPYEYLRHVPLERVQHLHVAGHRKLEDFLLDSHGAEVIDPVWDLFGYVTSRTQPSAVILERDHNIPPLPEMLHEVRRAREVFQNSRKGERKSLERFRGPEKAVGPKTEVV